jgi:hypothetical protein
MVGQKGSVGLIIKCPGRGSILHALHEFPFFHAIILIPEFIEALNQSLIRLPDYQIPGLTKEQPVIKKTWYILNLSRVTYQTQLNNSPLK